MSKVKIEIVDKKVNIEPVEQDVVVLTSDSGPQGIPGPQGDQGEPGPQGDVGDRGSQILSGMGEPSPVIGLDGDYYINISTGGLYGPKTGGDWGNGIVLGAGLLLTDIAYTHYQTVLSDTWTILQADHNLQFNPNVTVVDVSGTVVEGYCQYNSGDITVTFSEPIGGLAFLS